MSPPRSSLSRKLPVALLPHELQVRTWIQMTRTFSRFQRRLEQSFMEHGLSLAQFDLLATLRSGEGITQQELASRLLVTKGNVCGLIDRAEAAGWVERRVDETDRRANRLYLTKQGRQLLAASGPDHQALLKRMMSGLTDSELQLFHQFLDRLEAGAEGES